MACPLCLPPGRELVLRVPHRQVSRSSPLPMELPGSQQGGARVALTGCSPSPIQRPPRVTVPRPPGLSSNVPPPGKPQDQLPALTGLCPLLSPCSPMRGGGRGALVPGTQVLRQPKRRI